MGSFKLRAVTVPPVAPDAEPYEAEDIAAFSARRQVTAMRVVERGGDFFYGGEVEVFIANLSREIGKHSFMRLEVKCGATADSPIKNGHHAVLSSHPYSLGWCHFEPFKPPRPKKQGMLHVEGAEQNDRAEVLKALARLDCDYWEAGRFRTAGFACLGTREGWGGQRDNRLDLLHVLGVCEDANAYQAQLLKHPRIQELLAETEKRTIRIGHPDESDGHARRVSVHQNVAEEGAVLMRLAIRQALAGPHRTGEGWVKNRRPVHEKVERIYRELLNARNRSVVRKLQREVPPRDDEQ